MLAMEYIVNYIKALKNIKNKKIIIGVVSSIIFMFISIFLVFGLKRDALLDEVVLKSNGKDSGMFVILTEQADGSYANYEKSEFPTEGYSFSNFSSACIDNQGNTIPDSLSFDDVHNQLILRARKAVKCYLYFDITADLKVRVKTIDESGTREGVAPTLGYTKDITCDNGSVPTWDYKYNRLVFSDIIGKEEKCTLTYNKDTKKYSALIDIIENDDEIAHETINVPDYTTVTKLTETEYGTYEEFYASGSSYTYGTTTDAFDFETDSWVSVPSAMTKGKYYNFKFNIPSDGHYKICYNMSIGNTTSKLYIYQNGAAIKLGTSNSYVFPTTYSTTSGCVELGNLSTTDFIRVVEYAYSSSSYSAPTITFSLQKVTEFDVVDAGYRYDGQNPDNYLWFNNEMWRVIGSIPVKTDDNNTKKLIKIIRKNPIGGISYDAKSSGYTGSWGENTLYTLLNNYYYDGDNDGIQNGTDTDYCYSYRDVNRIDIKTNCDYTNIGFLNDNYYGKMIKKVYWNTGSVETGTAANLYLSESANQTVQNYVGLMNYSDYAYAPDWLGSYDHEWTLTEYPSSNTARNISFSGISNLPPYNGNIVRPVVYLNENVYVVNGDGTEANPYQIAM